MAEGLVARGHAVTVFCARTDGAPPGVHTRRVPVVRAGRVARLLSFAALAPRLARRGDFDVVVGFGRTTDQDVVRVGGGTHATYLRRMTDAGIRGAARGPYHRAILWLESRMFAPTGHRRVLAVAAGVAREVRHDYHVAPERIHVVYNGVDGARFHPARAATDGRALRAELGIGPTTPVCAIVGTGFRRKGVDLGLALWESSTPPRGCLMIVGDDERLAAWRRRAAKLHDVHVLGPRADIERVFAAASVVCVPSRQEAFGNVVLEACASGVPVVTSHRVGAAELLDGVLAQLVIDDPSDTIALRDALDRATGPDGPMLGRAGRSMAEARPWARHLDELEGLLREVADA